MNFLSSQMYSIHLKGLLFVPQSQFLALQYLFFYEMVVTVDGGRHIFHPEFSE